MTQIKELLLDVMRNTMIDHSLTGKKKSFIFIFLCPTILFEVVIKVQKYFWLIYSHFINKFKD